MTTISYKDGILASDSRGSMDGIVCGHIVKIFRLSNGKLVGISGAANVTERLLKLIDLGINELGDEENFSAFVANGDGTFDYYNESEHPCHFSAEFFAIGSGRELALGAMAAGASAEESIRIASDFDNATGGRIQVLRFSAAKK